MIGGERDASVPGAGMPDASVPDVGLTDASLPDASVPGAGVFETEWALLRLSWLYARAMDRNQPDILRAIFTDDAVLEGPDFKIEGLAAILALPAGLHSRYSVMMHTVHNQTVEIEGDRADGETYCVAHHILETAARGGPTIFDMGIRYQNQWVRSAGIWRFSRRQVTLDWTEIRAARRTMT